MSIDVVYSLPFSIMYVCIRAMRCTAPPLVTMADSLVRKREEKKAHCEANKRISENRAWLRFNIES